jgi:hypothetical protein
LRTCGLIALGQEFQPQRIERRAAALFESFFRVSALAQSRAQLTHNVLVFLDFEPE